MNENELKQKFLAEYGGSGQDIRVFRAPGRVNLIGEHTDYNGGYVFPAALTFGTTLLIRRRGDRSVKLASGNFPLRQTVSLDRVVNENSDDWTNYPKGVLHVYQQQGKSFHGYDMYYYGEIPNGAGLSSSASIEVVTAYALLAMEGYPADTVEIAQVCQKAENEFVGVNCGIMDQFASANGKSDHAVLLMCDTLEYRHTPFQTGRYKIIIANTNKKRGLVDSAYNERRSQCEQAVRELQAVFPQMTLLGQLSEADFNEHAYRISDEIVRNRARHVVEENERVKKSVKVLEQGDLADFGRLMTASHRSLRDLYAVTGKELDVLAEAAWGQPGVLGSRMTGAGFGGCTVSLVQEDQAADFQTNVGKIYKAKTGLTADFYVCDIGDGVKEIKE